jgi:seryl-tRNA synthetase
LERSALHEAIDASVQTDQHRQELFDMGKTIADELKEEGMLKARRQTLIRQLGKRFGEIPDEMIRTIETTQDAEELDRWLDNVLTAKNLGEVGIASAE